MGQVERHPRGCVDPGQRDHRVPELRQRAGHAGRPRRPFGSGRLQRRSVATPRGLGEGLHDVACDPRGRDLDRSVRRKPPAGRYRRWCPRGAERSEEHTSELQSLMRISYAVFCLKKKIKTNYIKQYKHNTYKTRTTEKESKTKQRTQE